MTTTATRYDQTAEFPWDSIRAVHEAGLLTAGIGAAYGGLPATTVKRTENGWLLNGRKAYGTGSEGLAYHLVWAVTPSDGEDEPLLGHLGLRASSTHDVVYENVEVPAENFPGVPISQATIGNPGLTRHDPLERQCCGIHPPQDDTALIAAGRRTLSQPR